MSGIAQSAEPRPSSKPVSMALRVYSSNVVAFMARSWFTAERTIARAPLIHSQGVCIGEPTRQSAKTRSCKTRPDKSGYRCEMCWMSHSSNAMPDPTCAAGPAAPAANCACADGLRFNARPVCAGVDWAGVEADITVDIITCTGSGAGVALVKRAQ